MTTTPPVRWLWLLPEARRALKTRELAVILRCYRKITGLSQVAMGELLGYDPSYVSLLERRQRTINDRQGLSHISRVLGVPPHALGITSDEDADFLAALQFGESTVRLAEIARQAGRATEAVEELWPLVVRLEARLSEGRVDYGTASLLARARATLGTSLGHVLAEEQLYLAARWTGGAMRLARHLDEGDFLGHVLRMHGNELRKAGRSGAAIARLTEAAELANDEGERGQTFVLIARAAGEQGDVALHDEALSSADLLMDSAGPSGILFTPFSLREVRVRGLLGTGRASAAAELARARPGPGEAPAPQWAVIEAVTSAGALSEAGDLTSAHTLYSEALSLASRLRLPHQIQRVVRNTAEPGLEEVRSDALARLHGLLDSAELTGYEFHDVPSAETVTIPRLARRIAHGARARCEGTTLYLENGEVVA